MLDSRGGIFVRRSSRFRTRISSCCKRWRGSFSTMKRAPSRSNWNERVVLEPRAPPPHPCPPPVGPWTSQPFLIETCPRKRLRRLHPRRPRICHHPQPGQMTPAPWVNVIAKPVFRHGGFGERLGLHLDRERPRVPPDPWSNDPVQDTTGEAFYLRDEQTGQYWSPTPSPARGVTPYVIRHGFGYTVFEHTETASLRVVGLCGDGRPGEIRGAETAQRLGPPAPPVRHRLLGMGAWAICGRKACCTCRPKWTSRPARCWRAILQHRFPGASRVSSM
jgi:hypothetical protein